MTDEVQTSQSHQLRRNSVLLIPGLCGTYRELGAIPKVLEDSGYDVTIAEIPGYADKNGPINWISWLEDLNQQFSILRNDSDTAMLVGLSMGATLALKLAQKRDDIDGMVLLSPVLRYDGWSTPFYHLLIRLAYWIGFRNWSWQEKPPYGIANLELRKRVQKAVEQGDASEVGAAFVSARHMHAAQLMMADVRLWLGHIHTPTLVIHAVDDETAAPRNAEEILSRINSEVRRVIWLGDSYHIITVDNEREIVVNETTRFLDDCRQSALSKPGLRDRVRMLRMKDRRK